MAAIAWIAAGVAVLLFVDRALEIGPGQVLAGLCKRIDKAVKVWSVGSPESVGKAAESF